MSDWKIIHGFEDYEVSRHGQVRRATAVRKMTELDALAVTVERLMKGDV